MNRRTFVIAGTACLALSGRHMAAFQTDAAATVLVSALTDAEIDFTASGFALVSHTSKEISGTTGSGSMETITLQSGAGEISIEFSTVGVMNMPRYLAQRSQAEQAMAGAEELALETFETGGYLVLSDGTSVSYLEYQLAAFPNADMIVSITTDQSAFREELSQTQTIMVGGAPPYLFLADSGVETLELGGGETVTAVPSRSSRSSTQSTATNTSPTTAVGGESDYVNAVITHRSTFITSYDEFSDHLATVGADTTTETDKATLFTQMNDIALTWQEYPTAAKALAIPPGLQSLGAIYGEWADVIGEMGTLFEELYMGTDTVDAFIAAVTDWESLDAELEAELSVQGSEGFSRAASALNSIKIGLRATRRAIF